MRPADQPTYHGLLLAAGAGTRMGRPKALLRDETGEPWVRRGVRVLREGGCDQVTVVLGAGADEARPLLDGSECHVVVAEDWAEGLSASLRAGLVEVARSDALAVAILLVDLPDVTAEVVRNVAAWVLDPDQVARAAYDGRPGHPVVVGRDHWADLAAAVVGDRGARDFLDEVDPLLIDCGDLATGRDVDTPDKLGEGPADPSPTRGQRGAV